MRARRRPATRPAGPPDAPAPEAGSPPPTDPGPDPGGEATDTERRARRRRRPDAPAPETDATPRRRRDDGPGPADEAAPSRRPDGPPARSRPDPEHDRSLRGLLSMRGTQVPSDLALRAREAAAPTEDDLAEAEREVVVVRRHYRPPAPLPTARRDPGTAARRGVERRGRRGAGET